MVFYGFISIPGGHFHACLVADRGGGELCMFYIQGNAYITTSLFLQHVARYKFNFIHLLH